MTPRIACIGGACIDHLLWPAQPPAAGHELAARSVRRDGGVARNVAENLARLGVPVALAALVGDDDDGAGLTARAARRGIDVRGVVALPGRSTAAYVAIFPPGEHYALADTAIFAGFDAGYVERVWPLLAGAEFVFADTNVPAAQLTELAARCAGSARFVLGASSVPCMANVPPRLGGVDLVFMNEAEAAAYLGAAGSAAGAAAGLVARGARAAVVTQGAAGCVVADPAPVPVAPAPATVVDPTGAGDALLAGALAELLRGASLQAAVAVGTVLAALTVERAGTVRPDLTRALLDARCGSPVS